MARHPESYRTVAYLQSPLIAAALAAGLSLSAPIVDGALAPVLAQGRVEVSAEFRAALQPYGRWERHARWG